MTKTSPWCFPSILDFGLAVLAAEPAVGKSICQYCGPSCQTIGDWEKKLKGRGRFCDKILTLLGVCLGAWTSQNLCNREDGLHFDPGTWVTLYRPQATVKEFAEFVTDWMRRRAFELDRGATTKG